MSGKPLQLLDHMLDIGPIDARTAQSRYGLKPATFRGLISDLREAIQIKSEDIWIDGRRYKQHSLRQ